MHRLELRLGLAHQPAKREDSKEDTNVEQTGNSRKQLQFKDTAGARMQETAGSKETPRQEGKTLLQADQKKAGETPRTLHITKRVQQM